MFPPMTPLFLKYLVYSLHWKHFMSHHIHWIYYKWKSDLNNWSWSVLDWVYRHGDLQLFRFQAQQKLDYHHNSWRIHCRNASIHYWNRFSVWAICLLCGIYCRANLANGSRAPPQSSLNKSRWVSILCSEAVIYWSWILKRAFHCSYSI